MSTQVAAASARTAASGAAPSPGLAARYYTDERIAAIEKEHVFAKTWQLAGHETDLVATGSKILVQVAGREVVVVRQADGSLRAHLNVCRHRGSRLVTGPERE